MDITLVSLICFVGISLVAITIFLAVRDLAFPGGSTSGSSVSAPVGRRLRRKFTVFDETPAQTMSGRIDQGFERLMLESGAFTSPVAGFLLVMACGLLISGILWIVYENILSTIAGALIGMTVPLILMMLTRARRMRKVQQELPYVLDLIGRAVRAGESLDQAITLVGNEAGGVLGPEFNQCARQLDMGRSVETVMKSLAMRIRLMELRLFATTLSVHRQAGGNLPETLERMSQVVRDRITGQRQLKAATGAGRASALLIATISPLAYLIMFLWQPEHIRVLYEDPLGLTMLVCAVILEIVGILWVAALLRNDS